MQKNWKWLGLQFFGGEGASSDGDGGDGGAATGVGAEGAAADAGQVDVLEKLGVPKNKVEKYRARKGPGPVQRMESAQDSGQAAPEQPQDAAAETPVRDYDKEWQDIQNEPEFNKRMQETVSKRVKESKQILSDLAPMIEVLGRKYGIDTSDSKNIDYKALSKAVSDDDSYYEDMASEMGVTREQAKALDQREREAKRKEAEANQTLEQQMLQQHFSKLQAQAAAFQQILPGFNLEKELDDPNFFRMTSPGVGLSVEQAYYALHHREIEQAKVNATAQRTAQALSASIQAGRSMPAENGSTSRAASPMPTKLYHEMTREERAAWLKQAKGGKQFR